MPASTTPSKKAWPAEHPVHRRVEVPVQHVEVPEGFEDPHHADRAHQAVEPVQGLGCPDERRVVLHDEQRPVR